MNTEAAVEQSNENELVQDVGFGRVAARREVPRLLNRDGSFNTEKYGISSIESLSLYHAFLTMTWPRFFLGIIAVYLSTNVVFSLGFFFAGPEALSGLTGATPGSRFLEIFFFSVQTISTIGYGNISPHSLPANILVTVEAIVGLIEVALVTGIVFARFARPVAKIRFSDFALISPFQGKDSFQFRIMNLRRSQLVNVRAQLLFSLLDICDGKEIRRYHRLALYIDYVPFFPLYWTVSHVIDEDSPLWKITKEDLRNSQAEFLISLTGNDDAFSDIVHTRTSYRFDEVIFGARFEDMYVNSDSHQAAIDATKLSSYQLLDS